MSYERAGEQMKELEEEIAALLAKAEDADGVPLEDGLRIPDEVNSAPGAQGQAGSGPRRDGGAG